MSDDIKVSVIMPTYNEEDHVEKCFHRVVDAMKSYGQSFEVILEEDGSTDKTPQIFDRLAQEYPFVKALKFHEKMGKGFGIRKCFEEAKGEYVVLIDSDMEYPPEKIPDLLRCINGNDIVIGSRRNWENVQNGRTRTTRAILSLMYVVVVKSLFGVDFRELTDFQSGFKAFRRRVIDSIQPITSKGFEIDTEIIIKALRKGYKVGFIPITYTYKGSSKVNVVSDSLNMFISLLKWKANGKLGHFVS